MNDVNEARFDNIDRYPKILSSNKSVGSPDIRKFSKRKPFIEIKALCRDHSKELEHKFI